MLELLLGIATTKYKQTKVVSTYHEALSMLFGESFGDYIGNNYHWDYKNIWNNEINNLLLENDYILGEIYRSNSGKFVEVGM